MGYTFLARDRRRRRRRLLLLCIVLLLPLAMGTLVHRLGGAFEIDGRTAISPRAQELVRLAFADIGPEGLYDYHTHVVGLGAGGTGIELKARMQSWFHPLERLKFEVYVSASGIQDRARADQEYTERLLGLIREFPKRSRHLILGFERYYDHSGTMRPDRSEVYVPNEYIADLARKHPAQFEMGVSVHPYRSDSVQQLERWAARGVRVVKWLPNAMGIHPADPRTAPFYAAMRRLNLILLTHAGEEKAVEAKEDQALGNPLFLRAPLQAGVRVVVAHCASLGKSVDLDAPGQPAVDNFVLFMRLFDSPRYRGRLYGEISAMTQANRLPEPMLVLLRRPDLHARLVNGSDYPLPAVNVVIRTRALLAAGLITAEEREALNEIYRNNPLLFDFVTKRTLRDPTDRSRKLSPGIFQRKIHQSIGR